jgi:YaiO family outer membrane protein
MLFSALIATLLLLDAPAPQTAAAPPPTMDQAVQLANEGRDAEALRAFQQIAADNPDDLKARLWIAQLHERDGDLDLAEPVYRSILLEDPQNLEAMLGVVTALLARDEYKETLEILEVAEKMAPQDDRVLSSLGRANRLAGHHADSISYFERAVSASPTEQHRLLLENARRSYMSRVETRGFNETFNGSTPDSRSGTVAVNLRANDTLRVIGRGEIQRKFGSREERGGAGFEWRWTPAVTLRAHALLGPGNLVLPEGDYLGEAEVTRGIATWTASVRYFDFTGARSTVVSPAVEWPASNRLSLGLRYAFSWTSTSASSTGVIGHTLHVNSAYRLSQRVSLLGAYAGGVDDFESFTIDRIGDFRANAVSGGLRIELATLTTIAGTSEYQWRPNDVTMGRVIISLAQRF